VADLVHVGVTGSRTGASPEQLSWLLSKLVDLRADVLHHGDCVGVDAQAHALALDLGLRVVVHPPSDPKHRAYCEGGELRPELPYLERDREIVRESQHLLALPAGSPRQRSGTWATVRYAQQAGITAEVLLRGSVLPAPTPAA
jgi:hypothetical protein